MKKIFLLFAIFLILSLYYFFDYKRHIICDQEEQKFITIWTRFGNVCYIIPGKYYGLTKPSGNYIETASHRNYIGIVWQTKDSRALKISVYGSFRINNLDTTIAVYDRNELMLNEYGITTNKENADSIKRKINYEYIDLNRVIGIKVFRW